MELTKDVKAYLKRRRKLMALEYARRSGSVAKALKEFNVPKATYYKWKKIYDKDGADGLLKKHPGLTNLPTTKPSERHLNLSTMSLRSSLSASKLFAQTEDMSSLGEVPLARRRSLHGICPTEN